MVSFVTPVKEILHWLTMFAFNWPNQTTQIVLRLIALEFALNAEFVTLWVLTTFVSTILDCVNLHVLTAHLTFNSAKDNASPMINSASNTTLRAILWRVLRAKQNIRWANLFVSNSSPVPIHSQTTVSARAETASKDSFTIPEQKYVWKCPQIPLKRPFQTPDKLLRSNAEILRSSILVYAYISQIIVSFITNSATVHSAASVGLSFQVFVSK